VVRIRSVLHVAVMGGGILLLPHAAHPAVPAARHDAGAVINVVEYLCTTTGTAQTQIATVSVELTMPAGAVTGQPLLIGWRGFYTGDTELRAPAAGLTGAKLYAYASISDLPQLSSATGVHTLGTVPAGQAIPLPATTVSLRTTSRNAGTASVRPAAINFGPRPTEPVIECEVLNKDDLTPSTLTVTTSARTPSPSHPPVAPTATISRPTRTVTATVTEGGANPGVTRTPVGAADTGGGGTAGPDGRHLVLTGSLFLLAGATGHLLRRRVHLR
jgi:hypothetical protein